MLDIRDFGMADPTGVQSSWQALQNAITAAASAITNVPGVTGGVDSTVFVPNGTFLIDKQVTIPGTGGSQLPLRIVGTAWGGSTLTLTSGAVRPALPMCNTNGTTLTTDSGHPFLTSDVGLFVVGLGIASGTVITTFVSSTQVTLSAPAVKSYPTTTIPVTLNAPKIITSGSGLLAMENLTLADVLNSTPADAPAPFIQSFATTLRLSKLQFVGARVPMTLGNYRVISAGSVSGNLLTFLSAQLVPSDQGAVLIEPTGAIPPDTYIEQYNSPTSCIMSQSATTTGTTGNILLVYSRQDAIVLGGTSTSATGPNAQFGGYGTVIHKCAFYNIRRTALLRSNAEGVVFRDHWVHNSCAAGFSFEAVVDLDGNNALPCLGCTVAGNVAEISFYTNGIRLNYATRNTIVGNYVSDTSSGYFGALQNAYLMTAASSYNLITGGEYEGAVNDYSSGGLNTVILPYPQFPGPKQTIFSQPVVFRNNISTSQSSSAQSLTTGVQINFEIDTGPIFNLGVVRVTATANVTGIILQIGTWPGQEVWIVNESGFTIQFAASATSNVADGAASSIPANTGRHFVWDSVTHLWYRLA